jgi:prepilin-type N-terminal cleavage/methylation domain-containing protein
MIMNKKAFTLLEMIVSISMILIIMVIFIVNYRSANKRTDLTMTAQMMVADIHSAQNSSLGLVKYGTFGVPAGGWGINFSKDRNAYVVFADLEEPGVDGYMAYEPSVEGDKSYGAREIFLGSDIRIENIRLYSSSGVAASTTEANVTFLPPDPRTNICNAISQATSTAIEIDLKSIVDNRLKTLRVNFLGLIEAKE